MRVYLTSTPEELEPHQAVACDVAHEHGLEPVLRDAAASRGLEPVHACTRQVAAADLVLVIAGFRRGRVPPPELGGDGLHPWTWWEVRAAFEARKPVVALLAGESWRPELREAERESRAVVEDLRGELSRLALFFDEDDEMGFRQLIRRQLDAAQRDYLHSASGVRLRRWPSAELPERPYPVLLPYSHPALFAGRGREIDELRRLLLGPVPVTGFYAASGAGKSSLLSAGLVPTLRTAGIPVAFDRHPCEPGLAQRLLGDIFNVEDLEDAEHSSAQHSSAQHSSPQHFVDQISTARQISDAPPILVIDQFEDLLRRRSERRARAVLGSLLAASVQRLPGLDEAPCRWLLAYRQELHGEVFEWLSDVLRDARSEGMNVAGMPYDLSRPERFQGWPLPPLGTPPAGSKARRAAASRAFQAAIERPLRLRRSGSEDGGLVYPWRFAKGGAERLALAFADARLARPSAPLAPELQVVLAHLLGFSENLSTMGGTVVVEVPDEPAELIDRALEEHLRRSIDAAFPALRGQPVARTRALLALRELAVGEVDDLQGRRGAGIPVEVLARAIGPQGSQALENLATPETRLVVLEEHGGEWCYVLAHDRLAEVLVQLVDRQAYGGQTYNRLGVDPELLGLRRFVALQSELFSAGEIEQATALPSASFKKIAENVSALVWTRDQEHWWKACVERRRRDILRRRIRGGLAVLAVLLVAILTWTWADRFLERRTLVEQVAAGAPEAALAALAELTSDPLSAAEEEKLRGQLRQRRNALDVLERGLSGVEVTERGAVVQRIVELAMPLIHEKPDDPVRVASAVWALDFFALRELRPGALGETAGAAPTAEARNLREEVLAPLRRLVPPPEDTGIWVDVPAGSFLMGSGPGDNRDEPGMMIERPRHQVTLEAFQLQAHEVKQESFLELFPDHEVITGDGTGDLPATGMTWYEAYTYAAWIGGRLPTEAEWERAARGGCTYDYCRRDGTEASLDEVGWWFGNTADPESERSTPRRVMQLEPSPWGFYDLYGNVWEICANWLGPYPASDEYQPVGPTNNAEDNRAVRGGSVFVRSQQVAASTRDPIAVGYRHGGFGFRVLRSP